ncbi:hypothetical protein BTJ45_04930 [Bacillus mycoides]|nr:hypothetical protein BTJ45_04930 [Bacillus mycoides]
MPKSQFDEKLVATNKELEDTIQKVQQFERKKEKSNAEDILNTLNKQVQMAKEMSSLSYTDLKLQAFFAQDALAKGIYEMDTKITNAEKEAEREIKKKREEWAYHHPAEAWLQDISASFGKKWDELEKGTRWLGMLGTNYPALKRLSDEVLVLEGLIGAAGSTISGAATGVIKSVYLVLELGELGIRGVETEQWKLDDLDATWEGTKKLAEYGIVGYITTKAPHLSKFLNNPELTDKIPVLDNLARAYRKDEKEMYNAVKDYVKKAMTDPYAFGGMMFDIGSFCVGVGEVAAVVNGGKIAEGANLFQAAGKSDKIVGKSEEVAALTNKLPGMKNALEKIRNMEIRDLSPETSAAGVGSVEERKTLGTLFSVAKSETKGTGKTDTKGARYGERKISDQTYGKLRRASPSSKIQKEVNKNIDNIIGTEDFALPGKIIDKKLHADHIVSLERMARMEGFETLTYDQQKEVANYVENFIGLSESANTSKGPKSYTDWYIYKKENIPVNPEFREKMILKEKELEIKIQEIIDEFNRINKQE